jgi:hypothetical protein
VGAAKKAGLSAALQLLAEGKPVPVLRDARFFAAPALLGQGTSAPAAR